MKEITFLKQNALQWEEYEKIGTPTDLSSRLSLRKCSLK